MATGGLVLSAGSRDPENAANKEGPALRKEEGDEEVSPAEDLRMLEYSQRLRDLTRNALASGPGTSTGRTLFDAALAGGAKSMGQPVGLLAPGYRADIAVLDADHPALIGRSGDAVLDSWIFSGGNACVKDVFVGGSHVVKDRHHAREDEIEAGFRAAMRRLSQ